MSDYFSLFSQVYHLQDRILTKKLKSHPKLPINAGQMRLLMSLWESDKIYINEVGKRNCLKKSTISTMLPRLVRTGLIEIEKDEKDKRARYVKLTNNANELRKTHLNVSKIIEDEIFKNINQEEKETFLKVLNSIKENLIKKEKEKC